MGMTIDEAIKYYLNKNIVLTEEEALANTIALNTMRKYQKIEQIVKEMKDSKSDIVGLNRHNTEYYMDMIERVLEDGKID